MSAYHQHVCWFVLPFLSLRGFPQNVSVPEPIITNVDVFFPFLKTKNSWVVMKNSLTLMADMTNEITNSMNK